MNDDTLRRRLVAHARSLFERGYSCGTSGNISARIEGGYVMTPTNYSLGALSPESLSTLDHDGRHVDGPPPTKEAWLHLAMYRAGLHHQAVVHLHSTHAVALSCRSDRDPADVLPPLTPYVVMRVGTVALVPYARPGDSTPARQITALAASHQAVLLANHGPVVSGSSLDIAVAAAEELEETARLFFLLENRPHVTLTKAEVSELRRAFPLRRAEGQRERR
jgi:ribulose-5-phosphate 4-epimerase/fuculose-1-phosphate aldolase